MAFVVQQDFWFEDKFDNLAKKVQACGLQAAVTKHEKFKVAFNIASRVTKIVKDPNHSTAEVVKTIEQDPVLAANVLRTANSVQFGARGQCSSIAQAVFKVGSRVLSEIAMACSVQKVFTGTGEVAKVRTHCALTAGFSRRIGKEITRLKETDTYTHGLLHDLGKLLLLQGDKGEYAALLAGVTGHDMAHMVEREKYGYDHAVLAAYVLHSWNVPPVVCRTVAWHHQLPRAVAAGGEVADLVGVVRVADRLAYEFVQGQAVIEQLVLDPAAQQIGLTAAMLQKAWPDLEVHYKAEVSSDEGASVQSKAG